jgi:SNW domain-containing protein 1
VDSIGGVSQEKMDKILAQSKPHKGFQGTDSTTAIRDGPVQFEKEVDPFGFDEFMGSAKRGRDDQDEASHKKNKF